MKKYICLTIHTERLHDDKLWRQIVRLIDFFNKKNIRATWFSFNPAFEVYKKMGFDERKWIERLKYLNDHNQLIEQHTHFYEKEKGDYNLSLEHVRKRLQEDKNWLEKQGYSIRGFVSGGWRMNDEMLKTLAELGYQYDCSALVADRGYLSDRDHLVISRPVRFDSIWEIPTNGNIKKGGEVVYFHDYDLAKISFRIALKLFLMLNKKVNFITMRELYEQYSAASS